MTVNFQRLLQSAIYNNLTNPKLICRNIGLPFIASIIEHNKVGNSIIGELITSARKLVLDDSYNSRPTYGIYIKLGINTRYLHIKGNLGECINDKSVGLQIYITHKTHITHSPIKKLIVIYNRSY